MSPVDVVIVSFNTCALLRACLESVRLHAPAARGIVVDNASHDGSPEMVAAEFPEVTLIRSAENLGFGGANNLGIHAGSAPLLLFLNSDAALHAGAVSTLVAALEADPKAVMVGPRLENPDGSFQPSCRRIPNAWRYAWTLSGLAARLPGLRCLSTWYTEAEHRAGLRPGMVSGACFLARRDFLDQVGHFDPRLFLYEEETDLALPARALGLHVLFEPQARVLHHGGASTTGETMSAFSEEHMYRSKYLVFHKHYGPTHAWLAHALDRLILGASARRQRRRGAPPTAQASLDRCRVAYTNYKALV